MYASDYRLQARERLAGNWGQAIAVALVAALLGGAIGGANIGFELDLDEEVLRQLPSIVLTYIQVAATVGGILALIQFIVGGAVQLGNCRYLLNQHDGKPARFEDLFSQFHRFGDGFCLSLLTGTYIFLWSLLFIIPGIVATYKYAMAPYIMLENPGIGANDAITRSKELMYGHKGRLFCLEISFIGWGLLSALTLGIGGLFLGPYQAAAHTAFYRDLVPAQPAVIDADPF